MRATTLPHNPDEEPHQPGCGLRRTLRLPGPSPCVECGYDTQGTDLRFNCPECGLPIELSDAKNLLVVLDPKWLEGLNRGIAIQKWMMRVAMAVVVGFVASFLLDGAVPQIVVVAAFASSFAVSMWSAWLVATLPRRDVFPASIVTSGRLTRLCIAVVVPGVMMSGIFWWGEGATARMWAIVFLFSPVGLAGAIGAGCFVNFLCHVAYTFDDPLTRAKGHSHATLFYTGCVVTAIGAFVGFIFGVLSPYWVLPGVIGQLIGGMLLLTLPRHMGERLEAIRDASHRMWQDYYDDDARLRGRGSPERA